MIVISLATRRAFAEHVERKHLSTHPFVATRSQSVVQSSRWKRRVSRETRKLHDSRPGAGCLFLPGCRARALRHRAGRGCPHRPLNYVNDMTVLRVVWCSLSASIVCTFGNHKVFKKTLYVHVVINLHYVYLKLKTCLETLKKIMNLFLLITRNTFCRTRSLSNATFSFLITWRSPSSKSAAAYKVSWKSFDLLLRYGDMSISKMAAVHHLGIVLPPYETTHEVSVVVRSCSQISCQCDTQIWRYSYLNFSHIWLEMPI